MTVWSDSFLSRMVKISSPVEVFVPPSCASVRCMIKTPICNLWCQTEKVRKCLASVASGSGLIQWSEQFCRSAVSSQMSQSLSIFDHFLRLESNAHLTCTLVP